MEQQPVLAFDTHAAVVELVGSGMPERQAETVVRLQVSLIEQHFATRADIGTVNAAIESSRVSTETEFGKVYSAIVSSRAWTDARFESRRRETEAQFESLRHEVKADLASLKAELIKWMIGTNLAFSALIIAAIKVL